MKGLREHLPEQVVVTGGLAGDGERFEETAGRAFEPLFTTRARGTGLGLAIVQKIVEEHGGSVSLNSEPDSGTKAFVMIPIRQNENLGQANRNE